MSRVVALKSIEHRKLNRQRKLLKPRLVFAKHYPSELQDHNARSVPPIVKWRNAVVGPDGPPSPTTRHVLLTLALHMNNQGGSCFPSYSLLAKETGLSKRVIVDHMNLAHSEGWFERTESMGYASGWRRYEYQATVPTFGDGESNSPPRQKHTKRRHLVNGSW